MRKTVGFVAVVSGLLIALPAFAQSAPAPAGQPATPAPAGQPAPPATSQDSPSTDSADPKLAEAKQRYERGLQLYSEQNFEAARVEFERAYSLAPTYKILYNIGLCHEQLGDYVQALTALQKYLEVGGTQLSEARRSEVAKELAQIRPRIARVTVKTNVEGAEVLVDDQCSTEATSGVQNCGPLQQATRELLVNPGRRRITLRKNGYLPETSIITVAGSDKTDVKIELRELPKGYVEKKQNPWTVPTVVGWGATGVAAITAGIVGVLALNAKDDQKAKLAEPNATADDLKSARDKTTTLSGVTDALLITTGVFAVASAFFTIRMISTNRAKGPEAPPPATASARTLDLRVGPTSLGAVGTF